MQATSVVSNNLTYTPHIAQQHQTIANNTAGNGPVISALGSDANIPIRIAGLGTGVPFFLTTNASEGFIVQNGFYRCYRSGRRA
jgi:hypothetical protein